MNEDIYTQIYRVKAIFRATRVMRVKLRQQTLVQFRLRVAPI